MAKRLADESGYRRHERRLLSNGGELGFRLTEPAEAECYFCDDTSVDDSQEHIIAQWLQDELGMRGERFSPTYYFLDQEQGRGQIPATNLVSVGICVECNSGWMSKAEADFQPYFRSRRRDVAVEPIVRWFAKTAFVLNVTQNTRLLVPRDIRLGLAAGRLDERISVFFHRVVKMEPRGGRINWAQSGGATAPGEVEEGSEQFLESVKHLWACAIRLDDIVGTVLINPPGDTYRSAWEIEGAIALEDGSIARRVGWAHLPRVRVFANAAYSVPHHFSWGDAARFRASMWPWPAGAEGRRDVEAFLGYGVAQISGAGTVPLVSHHVTGAPDLNPERNSGIG